MFLVASLFGPYDKLDFYSLVENKDKQAHNKGIFRGAVGLVAQISKHLAPFVSATAQYGTCACMHALAIFPCRTRCHQKVPPGVYQRQEFARGRGQRKLPILWSHVPSRDVPGPPEYPKQSGPEKIANVVVPRS